MIILRRGEEIKQDGAFIIPANLIPPPIVCAAVICPFQLKVFADITNPTIDYNNDKTDFYFYGNVSIVSIGLMLQKLVNNVWTDSISITDSTYGSFFAFGKSPDFSGNNFIDDFNKKYTGVFLKWITVLQNKGAGTYRMKATYVDILGNTTLFYSKSEYSLYQWNCIKPNGTVRIETFNQGLRGTLDNNSIQIDYSTGWNSQIRLPGLFLYKSSAYIKEYNQYGDGDFNIYKPIINEQSPRFVLTKLFIPSWIVWYLSTNINQADTINITDYNPNNRFQLVKTPVMFDGDFAIQDNNLTNPLPDSLIAMKLEFIYAQNNLRKRNS